MDLSLIYSQGWGDHAALPQYNLVAEAEVGDMPVAADIQLFDGGWDRYTLRTKWEWKSVRLSGAYMHTEDGPSRGNGPRNDAVRLGAAYRLSDVDFIATVWPEDFGRGQRYEAGLRVKRPLGKVQLTAQVLSRHSTGPNKWGVDQRYLVEYPVDRRYAVGVEYVSSPFQGDSLVWQVSARLD
jgi:hypothetical protein